LEEVNLDGLLLGLVDLWEGFWLSVAECILNGSKFSLEEGISDSILLGIVHDL
jgi:hypothetical protein